MRDMENKIHSLGFRLVKLLLLAAILAFTSFQLLYAAGIRAVRACVENDNYVKLMDEKFAVRLQDYIKTENLSVSDTEKLNWWSDRHWEAEIQIFKEGILLYDSYYPEGLPAAAEGWEMPEGGRTLVFADGEAELMVYGSYGYRLYVGVLVAALLASFGIFLLTVMAGIRRTIRYIGLLNTEIRVLETGELDHPITVQGKDELATLAKELDDMRKAFREQNRREAELTEAYRGMITGMSHDLRTPLTSLLIYTEMLDKRRFQSEEQMWSYIKKISKKAHQMKQMSDRILEYALSGEREEQFRMDYIPEQEAFYDLFSEMESYLSQKGFRTAVKMEWSEHPIWVCEEYLIRILDNLVSNLEKYAEPESLVVIRTVEDADSAGFQIMNQRREMMEEADSSGIGLRNIRRMMKKMGGRCMVDGEGEKFQIELLFRK